jgi:putative acetyltransferase
MQNRLYRIEPVYLRKDVLVRPETPNELSAIRSVNEAAFGQQDEADLVDNLRADGGVLLSLVAEVDRRIVGHILFSRMSIETAGGSIPAAALAPVAVLPEHQRHGIGERLVRAGLNALREQGERIVIVVGHPDYYPRFGFSTEKACVLESPFPAEAFMAIELSPGALDGLHGKVSYPAAFGL